MGDSQNVIASSVNADEMYTDYKDCTGTQFHMDGTPLHMELHEDMTIKEIDHLEIKVEAKDFDIGYDADVQSSKQDSADNEHTTAQVNVMLNPVIRIITTKRCLILKFRCGFCNRTFDDVNKLNIHIYEHNDESVDSDNRQISDIARNGSDNDFSDNETVPLYLGADQTSLEEKLQTLDTSKTTDCVMDGHEKSPDEESKTKENRNLYQRKIQDEISDDTNQKEHSCPGDLSFHCVPKTSQLKKHISIHSETIPNVCTICGDSFDLPSDLYSHLTKHLESSHQIDKHNSKNLSQLELHTSNAQKLNSFVCRSVGKEISIGSNIRKHMIGTHSAHAAAEKNRTSHDSTKDTENNKGKCFECKTCFKIFKTAKGLRLHSKKLHIGTAYTCNLCGSNFAQGYVLNAHMSMHLGRKVSCHICSMEFDSIHKLNVHIMDYVHERRHRSCKCSVCGKHITDKSNLRKHMRRIHNHKFHDTGKGISENTEITENTEDTFTKSNDSAENETAKKSKLECEICGKMFGSRYRLNQHMNIHLGVKFPCSICDKEYDDNNKLKLHVEGIHERKSSSVCTVCGKQINDRSNMRKHMRRKHSGNGIGATRKRQFECEVCLKVFNKQSVLKTHTYTHSGIKPHLCNVCGASFSKRYTLDAHMNKHMGIQFPCDLCVKQFDNKTKLKMHIESVHERSRSCVCPVCGMQITDRTNLQKHMSRRHNDSEEFACTKCETAFKTKKQLDKHISIKHKQEKTNEQREEHPNNKLTEKERLENSCEITPVQKQNVNEMKPYLFGQTDHVTAGDIMDSVIYDN